MSEKEKQILEEIALIIPKLSEGERNFLLGVCEGMLTNELRHNRKKALEN